MILKMEHIPCNEQRLYFRGQQLEDDKNVEYYKIEHECIIELRRCMKVFIRVCTDVFVIEVEPTDTIECVKALIEKRKGIKCVKQELYYNEMVLEDKMTVAHYEIIEACLHLICR